jgi:hypothetical protein
MFQQQMIIGHTEPMQQHHKIDAQVGKIFQPKRRTKMKRIFSNKLGLNQS